MAGRSAGQSAVTVYPLTNYSFGSKEMKVDKDVSLDQKLARLKTNYETKGMRRSVEGILLVQEHNHPHVLMLQLGVAHFKLPGGRLRAGEDEAEGLKRKLTSMLSPTNPQLQTPWDLGECAGAYYRPNFDTIFYPYLPPHITRPKECKKLYIVPLTERSMFAVPANMKLVAVPIFELYENPGRYGPIIAALPAMLSRFRLNLLGATIPAQVPPAAEK
ncbi:hypothetical protein FOA52_004503 [Chlamydomonas sp. UWO 241]|nr:hypothetical protein FOA52_004503 [Chlamydomonas sp. UWO 241]